MLWIYYIQVKWKGFALYQATATLQGWFLDCVNQVCTLSVWGTKTPAPFIAACNKFKYLEIISKDDDSENSSNNDKQNCVNTQVTQQ